MLVNIRIKQSQCSPLAKGPCPVRQVVTPCHRHGSKACLRCITYQTKDPTKAIKGHINGRMIPKNTSRLHKLSDYYLKYLVSCSSTKRLFTPPKKWWPINGPSKGCSSPSIAHQKTLPGIDGCPFAINCHQKELIYHQIDLYCSIFAFFGIFFSLLCFLFLVYYFTFLGCIFALF